MRKIQNIIAIFAALALSVSAFAWTSFCYTNADARYARDNLNYLTRRMENLGITGQIPTHGIFALSWPLPVAVWKMAELSDSWTKGYLSIVGEEGIRTRDGDDNPYDTLSRLILISNDEDVQAIYEDIQFDAAICNPETGVDVDVLDLWLEEKEEYAEKSMDAYERLCFSWGCLTGNLIFFWTIYWINLIAVRKSCARKTRMRQFFHNRRN